MGDYKAIIKLFEDPQAEKRKEVMSFPDPREGKS